VFEYIMVQSSYKLRGYLTQFKFLKEDNKNERGATMFNKECTMTDKQLIDKSNDLLLQMTLKEKVYLLNGNWDPFKNIIKYKNGYNPRAIETNGCKRLNVSPVKFTDGPRGVVMGNSTCFPVSMARGASFDVELERRVGDVIGKESRAQGANYFAGVCINLLRHPAWGRAQETYSEDPFLMGEFGKVLTEAVQDHNVMACPKHYALNNIENSRFRVNIECDERTLREVYLPHFKKCFDVGAASVMGAYNLFRGDQCCESDYLLNKILRDEWGFEGFTSSDFLFGIRDAKKALEAGMDVEMPMPIRYNKDLLKLVESGKISETTLDTAVRRVIKTVLAFENAPEKMAYSKDMVACKEHTDLAREVAEKSMVLIKNKENVLPFNKKANRILVIGKLATKANTGDYGSSRIYAPYVVTQLEGFKNYFGYDVEIVHCLETEVEKAKEEALKCDCVVIIAGNDARDEGESVVPDKKASVGMDIIAEGYKKQGSPVKSLVTKLAIGKMSYTNKVGEPVGGDRESLSLREEEINIINAVGGINPNTVVSLVGGSMIMTKEWDSNVPAIIYSWYSGMEGGNVLPKILFGDVNPSGKLPFTIPTDESHLPYFSNDDEEITYDLYHGYTKLDKDGNKAAYNFGHGLSYTTFEYNDVRVVDEKNNVSVTVKVSNTGDIDGEEVIQLYVSKPESKIERQRKLLKGFKKVVINSGESVDVNIKVPLEELKYYDAKREGWVLEHGEYHLLVGSSSDEEKLISTTIRINNESER